MQQGWQQPQQPGWQQPPQPQQQWQQPQAPPPQQQQWQQPQQPPQQQWQQHAPPQQAQGGWGQQPQQQQWGQQQYGQQPPWAQPSMCPCCDQQGQPAGGCCAPAYPGQVVDPYCCGPPMPDQPDNTMCCDFTCWSVGLFFILSLIGFAVVVGSKGTDNIFDAFNVKDTFALQDVMTEFIPYQMNMSISTNCTLRNITGITTKFLPNCTVRTIFGSFGQYCMEDSLNAGTMVANLSHWTNFRGTLYFLAFVITVCFGAVVYAVHRQKNPQVGFMNQSIPQGGPPMMNPNAPIHLFDTPLYEVFRCVWFVTGTVVFFWVANAMTSYWNFIGFYQDNTVGKLHSFWVDYDKKHVASVVCVTLYLSWPLLLLGAEIGLWCAFVIPWLGVRSMLKPGLENVRPDLPLSDMPGWVRLDVFFTEAQQIRRLGFSNRLWEMVTGTKDAFIPPFDCCQNPMMMNGMPPQQWQQQQQFGAQPNNMSLNNSQMQQRGPVQPAVVPPRPGMMEGGTPMRQIPQQQLQQPPTQVMQPQHSGVVQQNTSGAFFPQPSLSAQETIVEESGTEKKEKKHKKDKGTKEKKDKGTKEKKEKKHKKDKGDDSD